MPDGAPPPILAYVQRRPEATLLHRVVEASLGSFLCEAGRRFPSGEVPRFVRDELVRYLRCGDFARGFARFRCGGCRFERLVAFTCKRRGFCPSCGGKRMTRMAAHLVDRVFPWVPVRQWVLTIPFALRPRLAFDHAFAREVLRALHESISEALRSRARALGVRRGRTGAVTAIQRFGSGLNLHVHFHCLVVDGVFDEDALGRVRFTEARPWTGEAIAEVLLRMLGRLERRGLVAFDETDEGLEVALDELRAASIHHRIALGPRRGQRVERLGARSREGARRAPTIAEGQRKARLAGFDLEAGTRIAAWDRRGLERLARYVLRPPIAESRLSMRGDGKVLVALKSPWPDGTTHLALTPLELLEKLAALVPRPHANLLVYHGVLAAHARDRERVVGYGRPEVADTAAPATEAESGDLRARSRSPSDWATLMKRGLELDVLDCPRCHGRLRLIALIDDERIARPLAERLGLTRRATGPPLPCGDHAETTYELDEPPVSYDE
ncbi:MAG: transposase [Polyangiales bacterium]